MESKDSVNGVVYVESGTSVPHSPRTTFAAWLRAGLLALIGTYLAALGVGQYGRAVRWRGEGVETGGVVAASEPFRRKGGVWYATRVTFRDGRGNGRAFSTDTPKRREPGSRVRVVYVPDDPELAALGESADRALGVAYWLFALGAASWGVGYWVWRRP